MTLPRFKKRRIWFDPPSPPPGQRDKASVGRGSPRRHRQPNRARRGKPRPTPSLPVYRVRLGTRGPLADRPASEQPIPALVLLHHGVGDHGSGSGDDEGGAGGQQGEGEEGGDQGMARGHRSVLGLAAFDQD